MYTHIMNEFYSTPWAIIPEKLQAINAFLSMRASGGRLSDDEIKAISSETRQSSTQGAVAVIPVYGVIAQRMDMMSAFSGGTSTERVTKQIQNAIADPSVGSILLDIDSPGGSVYGVQELAAEIYAARDKKPITAIANSLAASAAYWIGTAASELIVTPGGEVGSIGVITAHTDVSKLEESVGMKTTIISAGKYKAEGNQFEPLNDEAKAAIQSRIDDYYGAFVKAVAKHRGVSSSVVREGYGQGRVVGANEAIAAGMADGVATFDEVIKRMSKGKSASKSRANRLELQQRI